MGMTGWGEELRDGEDGPFRGSVGTEEYQR
jgi:hypothetical protein